MKLNKKGFTIVELVIVIAVIAILAAVLIPTFTTVTAKAKESAALQQATNSSKAVLGETKGDKVGTYVIVEKSAVKYIFTYNDGIVKGNIDDVPAVAAPYTIFVAQYDNTTKAAMQTLIATVLNAKTGEEGSVTLPEHAANDYGTESALAGTYTTDSDIAITVYTLADLSDNIVVIL